MSDTQGYSLKRLRPVWIGGLVGLVVGVILLVVMQPHNWDPDVPVMVPVHDIYGGLQLYDIRKVPFLTPVLGLMVGLVVKMYRDAVGHHRRRIPNPRR